MVAIKNYIYRKGIFLKIMWLQDSRNAILNTIEFTGLLNDLKGKHEHGLVLELVDSLDLKSSGIYSRGYLVLFTLNTFRTLI